MTEAMGNTATRAVIGDSPMNAPGMRCLLRPRTYWRFCAKGDLKRRWERGRRWRRGVAGRLCHGWKRSSLAGRSSVPGISAEIRDYLAPQHLKKSPHSSAYANSSSFCYTRCTCIAHCTIAPNYQKWLCQPDIHKSKPEKSLAPPTPVMLPLHGRPQTHSFMFLYNSGSVVPHCLNFW